MGGQSSPRVSAMIWSVVRPVVARPRRRSNRLLGGAVRSALLNMTRPSYAISKSTALPGPIPNRSRIGLGMVTCPFVVSVVAIAASVIPLHLVVLLIASDSVTHGTTQASVSYQRDGMEEEAKNPAPLSFSQPLTPLSRSERQPFPAYPPGHRSDALRLPTQGRNHATGRKNASASGAILDRQPVRSAETGGLPQPDNRAMRVPTAAGAFAGSTALRAGDAVGPCPALQLHDHPPQPQDRPEAVRAGLCRLPGRRARLRSPGAAGRRAPGHRHAPRSRHRDRPRTAKHSAIPSFPPRR